MNRSIKHGGSTGLFGIVLLLASSSLAQEPTTVPVEAGANAEAGASAGQAPVAPVESAPKVGPATLTLTNGEVSEVTVLSLEEGKEVTVRLPDGTEKVLPWSWVASLEIHEGAPPAGTLSSPPPVAAVPAAAPLVAAGGPVPGSDPQYSDWSTQKLKTELDDTGLGGPITLLSIGGGLAVVGTYWFFSALALKNNCDSLSYYNDYYYDDGCSESYTAAMIVAGSMVAVGVPLGIIGGTKLGSRLRTRRSLNGEIELRENYSTAGDFSMSLTPMPVGRSGHGLGFVGTF